MIRVVADTNVYISPILALARAGVGDLFLCPAIQRELRFVLAHT